MWNPASFPKTRIYYNRCMEKWRGKKTDVAMEPDEEEPAEEPADEEPADEEPTA